MAFLVRAFLIHWTLNWGYNGDFVRYEDWARIAHIYGYADTYTTHHLSVWKSFPNNQPPGSLYILSFFYESWIMMGKLIAHVTHTAPGSIVFVNTHLQHIVMKIPFLMSDLLLGVLVYMIVTKETTKKSGLLAAGCILFTPITFYNSAIWGQMDSVNNLFFMLALFFALRKHIFFSILSYAISLYIKFSLLPLLPCYLISLYFLSGKQIKKIIFYSFISISTLVIATFPIASQPLIWLLNELPIIARGEFQNISVAAFNFWWVVTCLPTTCVNTLPLVSDPLLGLSYGMWAYILFMFCIAPFLYMQVKNPKKLIQAKNIFLVFSVVALFVFLLLPNMHDRYMYPVFPLLSVTVGLWKNRTILIIFILLSLFHLGNLIHSWYPADVPFFVFYQIIYSYWYDWVLSVATVITGGWFYWRSIREIN